jgi:hypothetical protein
VACEKSKVRSFHGRDNPKLPPNPARFFLDGVLFELQDNGGEVLDACTHNAASRNHDQWRHFRAHV